MQTESLLVGIVSRMTEEPTAPRPCRGCPTDMSGFSGSRASSSEAAFKWLRYASRSCDAVPPSMGLTAVVATSAICSACLRIFVPTWNP